jgi:hypothetical protein
MCLSGVIAFALSTIVQKPTEDLLGLVLVVTLATAVSMVFLNWLRGMIRSGARLLDCGPISYRTLRLVLAGFALVWGSYLLILSLLDESDIELALTLLLLGATNLIYASGRLQIRENGIWAYFRLHRWAKIQSYEWDGKAESRLVFHTKANLPLLERESLPIREEQKELIDELLRSRIGVDA